jgi:hypothetical protein
MWVEDHPRVGYAWRYDTSNSFVERARLQLIVDSIRTADAEQLTKSQERP